MKMYKTHADFCEDFAAENCHRINCASCEEIFDFIKPELDAKDARIAEYEKVLKYYSLIDGDSRCRFDDCGIQAREVLEKYNECT